MEARKTEYQDEDIVDTVEAARFMWVAPGTMCNWRSARKGPKYSKAGRILYRVRDLREYMDARRIDPEKD